jgi:hypothetical protein
VLVLCDDANARDEENTRVSIMRVMHGAMRRRCARANDDHAKSRSRDDFIHNHATDDEDDDDEEEEEEEEEDDAVNTSSYVYATTHARADAPKSREVTIGHGQLGFLSTRRARDASFDKVYNYMVHGI